MRPASVTKNGYGQKAMAIFTMATRPSDDPVRQEMFQQMGYQFSPKSIVRKCDELAQRGYLVPCPKGQWAQASLTDKGRQALETGTMSG